MGSIRFRTGYSQFVFRRQAMLHTRALPFVRPDGRTAAEYTFETAGGAQLSVM